MLATVPARRSARVTTRTGDRGETGLFGKPRVRKTDPRIEALGDLDEAQSVIGVARAMGPRSALGRELLALQEGLYVAMSEVATPPPDLGRLPRRVDGEAIEQLERALASAKERVRVDGRFVVPGGTPLAAALDHARTVVRRAERRVVACVDGGLVASDALVPWLNRASDLLFVLARAAERRGGPARAR